MRERRRRLRLDFLLALRLDEDFEDDLRDALRDAPRLRRLPPDCLRDLRDAPRLRLLRALRDALRDDLRDALRPRDLLRLPP